MFPTLSREVVGQEREQWSRAGLLGFRIAFAITAFSILRLLNGVTTYVPIGASQVGAVLGRLEFLLRLTTLGIVYAACYATGGTSSSFPEFRNKLYANNLLYVLAEMAGVFVVVLCAAALWTLIDRRRANYAVLQRVMRVLLRFTLAVIMLGYALVKIIPTQFGFMTPGELLRPYGQLSGFWVLWNFMATSTAYTMLTGWAELLAAVLLFFRRTTLLGSLLLAGILINLLGMTIAYQVDAVLVPLTLLMLNLILLGPYLRPLSEIFLFRGPRALQPEPEPTRQRWYHSATAKGVLLCCLIVPHVSRGLAERRSYFGAGRPVWGIYDVVTFARKGEIITPLASDGSVWKRVAGDGRYDSLRLTVQYANADVRQFRLNDDVTNHVWKLRERAGPEVALLQYTIQPDGDVVLEGNMGSDPVRILLHRTDIKKLFPLWKE